MNRLQTQLGFVLILLALLGGLGMPVFVNTRLGLSAHTAGITGGLVLIALGALAGRFSLGERAKRIMHGAWAYAAFANWVACMLGALTGASRMTPIAGAGTSGTPVAEAVVAVLLVTLSIAALVGSVLAVYGLRRPTASPDGAPVH